MQLDTLKQSLYIHLEEIGKTAANFPWEDREHYIMWLRQTYAFVCHSTRLLSLTAALAKNEDIHHRFMDHSLEEKAHERLLERDFKSLDAKIEDYQELLSTMGIYQIQYYWVQHVDPIALFGYVLLLEGLAVEVGGEVYKRAKQAFGESACNFIRIHVAADEDHLPKAFKALENCPPEQLEIIEKALYATAHFYHRSIQEIMLTAGKAKSSTAA